jgi:hypothetical protein
MWRCVGEEVWGLLGFVVLICAWVYFCCCSGGCLCQRFQGPGFIYSCYSSLFVLQIHTSSLNLTGREKWCGFTLRYLHMCLPYILVGLIPSIIVSLSSPPTLEQFQQVSFFYFHIWIQNTSTIYPHSPFLCVHPWTRPIFPSYPLFIYFFVTCVLIVQGGCTLVFQVCIYCAFIKLTPFPSLLTHSLSPCSHNIQ